MLKRFLPRTLQGRTMLILAAPMALLLVVTATIFFERHWDTVTRRLALGVAGEIALVVENLSALEQGGALADVLATARQELLMDLTFRPGARLDPGPQPMSLRNRILDQQLSQALRERLEQPTRFDTTGATQTVEILVQLEDGVLAALVLRDRLTTGSIAVFFLWVVGSSLILLGVAVLFLRNQIRPIRALGTAAEAFGKGRPVSDLKPSGAIEVRQAAQAFNIMRARILQFVGQRTEMLAGVSHDLRTPLTRMRLQIAMLPEGEELDALKSDVDEMQAMVEGYLAFARSQDTETAVETDLAQVLHQVVANARRHGAEISLEADADLLVPLHPNAFLRCITNLVDNARRYAAHIAVAAHRAGNVIDITVDDDGPGIPESEREEMMRPFRRMDRSRNPDTGGLGLGLAIARDVIRSHGGEMVLSRAPQGGLRVTLRLPV